jgi:nucleoside-diphosphate-sugar epimerase
MFLLTGANGFVGKGLQETLRQRAIPFRTVSRDSCNGDILIGSVDTSTNWLEALKGIDVVVHLAAVNQNVVQGSQARPDEFRQVNVEGTINLAKQAAASGVRRFIYLSSVKVNGEWSAPDRPFTTSDTPKPKTLYAASKLEAEQRLRVLSESEGLETVVIRPPLVYGPGVSGSFLALTRLVAKQFPLPLRTIQNRRSMIYLENLTDLIVTVASHPNAVGGTFLAADRDSFSTPELLRMIAVASGGFCRLLPCPPILLEAAARIVGKEDLVYRLTRSLEVDMSDTRKLLDWTPPIPTREALATTLGSMKCAKVP